MKQYVAVRQMILSGSCDINGNNVVFTDTRPPLNCIENLGLTISIAELYLQREAPAGQATVSASEEMLSLEDVALEIAAASGEDLDAVIKALDKIRMSQSMLAEPPFAIEEAVESFAENAFFVLKDWVSALF